MNQIRPFPWSSYSKKLALRIENPYCVGTFSAQDAENRELHVAIGREGSLESGNVVQFYWLVDKTDGVIVDARFQAFGHSALIGASEVACELIIGKNYDQARRLSCELIDKHVRDKGNVAAFPEETYAFLNLVIDAQDNAAKSCEGISLAQNYVAPPILGNEIEVVEGGYPGFQQLTLQQKLAVIESVIAKEVRPYIEMDAGGIEVLNLLNDREVIISYQGACTSCHSATGATLSYIQQILKAKVHPDLEVTPNL